jgi:hypothetical protein
VVDAEARVRRVRSKDITYIAAVKCRKATADAAEAAALIAAERWIDRRESQSA